MRWLWGFVAAVVAFSPSVGAHDYTNEGTILLPNLDQADTGIFALVESLRPGTLPPGAFYAIVEGVQGYDSYTLTADEYPDNSGLPHPLIPDECPGPDWDITDPNDIGDAWLICGPGFGFINIRFECFSSWCNGPSSEPSCFAWRCHGTVPDDAWYAIVTVFIGTPSTHFVYHEW